MKHLYKSHFLSKSFAISLSLICWSAALFKCAADYNGSAAQAVTAFSTSSINHSYSSPVIRMINKTTYEISFGNKKNSTKKELYTFIFDKINSYDTTIKLMSVDPAKGYTDYYLYSPKLCKENNILPVSDGFNIHIAITDSGKIYLGLPYIDYDF